MYKLIVTLSIIVTAAFAGQENRGQTFVHQNVDFSGGEYGGGLCETSGRCTKTEISAKHSPIAHNCQALCRHDAKTTCASAYYSDTDRQCHLLSERCTKNELVDKEGNQYKYFYRLKSDEKCTDEQFDQYVSPEPVFSDTYCLLTKKRCPGPEMYLNKPWKNQKRQFCLDKCSKILTCEMVDWVPNDGEDADDVNAKGTCYHKVTKCTDGQLQAQEDSFNYLRLRKSDNGECPQSRKPTFWCVTADFLCSYQYDHQYLGFIRNVEDKENCKEECLKRGCGLFFHNPNNKQCSFRKPHPCETGSKRPGYGYSAYYITYDPNNCSEDLMWHDLNQPNPEPEPEPEY